MKNIAHGLICLENEKYDMYVSILLIVWSKNNHCYKGSSTNDVTSEWEGGPEGVQKMAILGDFQGITGVSVEGVKQL